MTACWASRFPRLELSQIGRLWDVARVEVCAQPDAVWVRGSLISAEVEEILRGFLSGKRFLVLPDGQIQSPKDRVPRGYLPAGPWTALRDWMTVGMPPAALPGRCDARLQLKLIPTTQVKDPDILVTHIEAWVAYGSQIAQVRLDRLLFAMAGDGSVLVRGRPLPSMPGKRLVECDGIAVPAGLTWSPAVEGAVLRTLFGLEPGDLAVLEPDGSWYRIRANWFVRATRQAIRTSSDKRP